MNVQAPLLTLKNLVVGYPNRTLTSPMNVEIPAGASVAVIGTNGSGKSTLIQTLLGLTLPLSGTCSWSPGATFGYVPQENQIDPLFPLTVEDLLKMGVLQDLPRFRNTSKDFETRAKILLEELGIYEVRKNILRELSGGQRQKALIARALLGRPQVLLMDEPFSSLDYLFHQKQKQLFKDWKAKYGFSLFLVEHDLNRVLNQVEWIILIGPNQTLCGKISEVITKESLIAAYGAPLHLHKENGEIQIHFL